MKKFVKTACAAAAALALFGVKAQSIETTILDVSDGPIVRGEWNSNYDLARDYADSHNVPLLVVYGGASCGNCTVLQRACLTDEFLAWQDKVKPVMVYTYTSSGALKFAKPTESAAIPYVGIYWNRDGEKPTKNSDLYKAFTGRDGQMLVKTGSLAEQFIASLNTVVAGFVYDGGEFMVPGDDANVRLEVEAGYAPGRKVIVPLTRDATAGDGSNTLAANGVPYPVTWAAGESLKYVEIAIPDGLAAGNTVSLELFDSQGKVHATSAVYIVEPVKNYVRNPYMIGEKTADELAWGDWTLDYETAKAKVAAAKAKGDDAYLIANFSGVFWCPYCNAAENTLLETEEFKAWAKANNVILVVFDQGRASTPATAAGTNLARLLSYETGTTSIAGRSVASGAGYLTRKGVSPDAAANGIALVTKYTQAWLAPGTTAARIGNPTFLLIGDEDNVVARFNAWRDRNNELGLGALNYDPAENIARLDDLLKLAGGEGERDNYVQTTTRNIASDGEGVVCALQVNDNAKVYAVGAVPVGSVAFTVSDKTADRAITLAIQRVVDGATKTLATGTDAVEYDFDKGETDGVFLRVSAFGDGKRTGADTLFTFKITPQITLHPGVVSFAETSSLFVSGTGQGSVTLKRTNGVSGTASVKVSLDEAAGTAKNGLHFTWQDTIVTWEEGDREDKTVTFALATVEEGARVAFTLRLSEPTVASLGDTAATTVEIFNTDKPTLAQAEYSLTLYTGFDAASSLNAQLYNANLGDNVVAKVLSGRMPAGVKVVYDPVAGCVTLKGTTKKIGTYTVEVAFEDKTTGSGLGTSATLTFTVANPATVNQYMSKALAMTVPLFLTRDDGTRDLEGTLTLTLKANNRITAKYVRAAKTGNVTFSGIWAGMDDGVAATTLKARTGQTLSLEIAADGDMIAVVEDSFYATALESGVLKANGGNLGASFGGSYTVALPEIAGGEDPAGTGYLTIKVTGADGKAKWSGMLANGQRVSGTATLVADADGNGVLAAFVSKPKWMFAAPLLIKPNAAASSSRRAVVCMDGTVASWSAANVWHDCKAWGSVFNSGVSLLTLCQEATLPDELTLMFDDDSFEGSTSFGILAPVAEQAVAVSDAKFALVNADRTYKLTYRQRDGIFTGSVKLAFSGKTVNAKFTGVIIPGWYDCHCDIPLPGDKFKIVDSMPLAVGALYYTGDKVNGVAAKRGFTVGIGLAE